MISGTTAFHIGIDVGSTAIKTIVVQPATGDAIWHDYRRHESRPAERLAEVLGSLERETDAGPGNAQAFMTGVAGAPLAAAVGARYVQEVPAAVVAVERRHPGARAIIEIGGHDAKIVVLERGDRKRQMVSVNDKCAGGTGMVIDKIAAKLKVPEPTLGDLDCGGRTIYPVAGKCGVFAETDINSLQKRGVPAEDLIASLFDAIVIQDLAGLARGLTLQPEVVLLGGPHAFIRGLRDAWKRHLARIWRERDSLGEAAVIDRLVFAPPFAAHLGAFGAIELGLKERRAAPACAGPEYVGAAKFGAGLGNGGSTTAARRSAPAIAASGLAMEAFRHDYAQPPWTPPCLPRGATIQGFVGLDAGSTSTKAVALSADGNVLAKAYQLSRGNPIEDGIDMFRALREAIEGQGATLDVLGLVTTGYAKDTLKEVFRADAALVETVAHARSALQLYDDPHVIVDVGGQDIKIIVLRDGRVKDFRLNTQCSAGNGYFLQAIAQTFGIPVESFADAAFSAAEMPVFGHGCVLFLQSEIAEVQRRGWRPEEILSGLAAVLPKNVFLYVAKAPNLARLGTRFVLQGGTQRNLAAVKAQVDFIRQSFRGQDREPHVVLHRHAGEAGAIGAALEAVRLWREGHQTTFIGLCAAERVAYRAHSGEDTRCRFCRNECLRTFIDVWTRHDPGSPLDMGEDSRRLIVATCEKGAASDVAGVRELNAHVRAIASRTPNLIGLAARDVWRSPRCAPPAAPEGGRGWRAVTRRRDALRRRANLRIGIPRALNLYTYAPLFAGYLETLGVRPGHIVYSDFTAIETSRAGSDRGSIDPCFPSKVALAHIHDLLFVKHASKRLDAIFFPMIDILPARFAHAVGSNACPTVTLTPQTVRAAFTRETDLFADRGVRYLDPLLDLRRRPLLRKQMHDTWSDLLECSREESDAALEVGFEALAAFEERIGRASRAALDALERENRVGIVLLGRPYHHDPGLHHGIPEELQKLGYAVFSQGTLPFDEDLLERLFGDEVRTGAVGEALEVNDVWKRSFSENSSAKLWAAKFAARHPNLVAVELSNFKCGHDAMTYSTIEEIVECSGTPFFAFRDLDENRPAGAIALRLETLDYALQRWRERLIARRRAAERVQQTLARYERVLRARLMTAQGPAKAAGTSALDPRAEPPC